ncbi:MAG: hypothetical protein ABS75_02310 [Pelagibacterium sp. SCN 63-23]|nr:MAG: hypothetical protein ABS75_02310 [Pelagibacterium sp. SCN 63-23]
MSLKSSPHRYGAVAIAIHWLSALAVIAMLASGQVMDMAGDPALVSRILPIHVLLGVVLGLLTLLRIVWFLAFDRRPRPHGPAGLQNALARIVHLALYAAILVMVASGVAMVTLAGGLPLVLASAALPDFSTLAPYGVHGLVSRLLLVLALGHIGAALWHHFVQRDGLLARMGLGKGG